MACGALMHAAPVLAQQADQGGELPSGARPGAIQPDRDDRRREPPEPQGPVLEIPPKIDRPLDPQEGQRIEVQAFELVDARDRPENDIRVEDLERILAKAREEKAKGFTVGELEAVANRLTNYYRERGLILAQAVVPVQTIEQGVVKIRVIEGRLGAVRPQGNQYYTDETIEQAFDGLIGKPVSQSATESALLALNEYPGLVAFGVFKPGKQTGEADVSLQVQNEDRFEGSISVDNHGTRQTGRGRARARVQWNNPTGNADRLTLSGLAFFQPENSLFGSLEYERLFGRHYRARGFIRSNRFDVGGDFERFDISGETDQVGFELTRQWIRSRDLNWSTGVGLTAKRSRTLRSDEQDNEDRLTVLTLKTRFDSVDSRFGGLNFAGLEINQGIEDVLGAMGDSESAADQPPGDRPSRRAANGFAAGEFTRLFGYYSRLQNIVEGQSLLLRTELQYSDDVLVPLEQYAIGGPNSVRAFPKSHALVDSGLLVSAEYVIEAPWLEGDGPFGHSWRDMLRASVFYDYAMGELNEPRASEPDGTVDFHGAGFGVRFDIPGTLESRLQIAWEIDGDDELADPDAVRSPQIWAEVAYNF